MAFNVRQGTLNESRKSGKPVQLRLTTGEVFEGIISSFDDESILFICPQLEAPVLIMNHFIGWVLGVNAQPEKYDNRTPPGTLLTN